MTKSTKSDNLTYHFFDPAEQEVLNKAADLLKACIPGRQSLIAKELVARAKAAQREIINARARARYRIQKAEEEKLAQPKRFYGKLSLAAGDIIKVKNTQDGHGLREVKSVEGTKVVCHQLWGDGGHLTRGRRRYAFDMRWMYSYRNPSIQQGEYSHTGTITRHDIKNVTHMLENGNMVPFTPYQSTKSVDTSE